MTSATIKLFLPHGDAKRLRVGEVSNWTGKALAAPRTELDDLLVREELENAGVYFLLGTNPDTGSPQAYIGEAEVIRDRLKQHKARALDILELTRDQLGKGVLGKYLQHFTQGSNVVILQPEISKAFPTSEAVNKALANMLAFAKETQGLTGRSSRTPRKHAAT